MAEALAKIKDNAIFPATTGDTDGSLLTNLIEALTAGAQLNVGQKGRVTHTAVNYTAATQIVDDHLAGIDTAFGGKASSTHKDTHKSGGGDAFTSSDLLEAVVKRLQVTGPVTLLVGAVADGKFLKRSGTGIVGDDPPGMSAHALGGSYHGADTLANVNALITGGDLDFDSASRPPNGSASGDLLGTYPGPTVAKIQGYAVQDHAPEDGEILKWIDGNSQYEPAGPVGCYVYRNAAVTLTDGDWVKIPFDTEVFDLGGNYDNSVNYRFDVPTNGYYLVMGRVRIAAPPDGAMMAIGIKRSGTFLATNYRVSGGAWTETLQIAFLLAATATQYIEVFAFQDSVGDEAITTGTHTTMQIMKLL